MTPKQAQFIREYLIDLNATQAAIRAGYSAKTAGQIGDENLKKPEIAAAIEAAMAKRAERTEITADRVLQELAKIGFSDIRQVVRWQGEEGADAKVEVIDSDKIGDDAAAAVAEISQTAQGVRIKLHDKKGALVDIGRHLGMFTDKLDMHATVSLPADVMAWLDKRG